MRILAGALKGRRLVTPRGAVTRPTADQVRLALMDTLAPRLPGARFLDLFAGAGGVGLEALSRGAAHATLVERDARALAALRANVEALGVAAVVSVRRGDVLRELAVLARARERFDVVFLDPPYETEVAGPVLAALVAGGVVAAQSVVIAQHLTKRPPPAPAGLVVHRTRRFGETTLTFYRPAGAPGTPAPGSAPEAGAGPADARTGERSDRGRGCRSP
jgi:16S rRNA (guanine966-N2)-methyltransferase